MANHLAAKKGIGGNGASNASASSRRVRIRQTLLDDYDHIQSLHLRNGLSIRPRPQWEALWIRNPVPPQQGEWPIGWVLETTQSEIVGSIRNIPLGYWFRGRRLCAATFADWAVDEPYRGYSIWLLSRGLAQQNLDFFIATTVSPAVEPLLRFLKWSPVPVGEWHTAAFWITNHRGFVNAFLNTKLVPLAPLVSYPVAGVLYCADRLRHPDGAAKGAGYEIELCSDFDARFDLFWQTLQTQHKDTLLADRSPESLAWHFGSGLLQGNVWTLAVHNRCGMVGYAIFDRADNPAVGLKRVRLVDFWALERSGQVLSAALRWMLNRCRRDGTHLLEVVGWHSRPEFRHTPPHHYRRLSAWIYYYKTPNKELADALACPQVWVPSSFDGDASLA